VARGLLGVASAIALLSLFSKVFGFGREVVIAAVFGASAAKDAYTIAYILPAFALVMLGGLTGPFHTATQKLIATLRQRGQDDDVPAAVATTLVGVAVLMGALSVLVWAAAPQAVALVGGSPAPEVRALAAEQLRIMAPLVLLGGLVGVFCGISNDRGDYTLPSLSPLVASLFVIGTVLWRQDGMALAWGTLAGGVGQFLLQAPAAWRLLRSGPAVRWIPGHPEVRAMAGLVLPASISSTIGTLNVMIGIRFTATLATGDVGVFDYANKLIQLPLGILMTALLIPIFPLLTQAAVAGDRPALFGWLTKGLQTIGIATLPLTAFFLVGGEPFVRLIFQRSQFDALATAKTAEVLALCALGIFAYASRDLMIRVFFALDDSRTPLAVSVGSLALTFGFMAIGVGYGLPGLAIATSAVTIVNMGLVAVLLRRKLGELPLGAAASTIARAAIAAAVGGAAAWGVGRWLPAHPADLDGFAMFVDAAVRVALQAGTLGAAYAVALLLLGVPLLDFAARLRRNRV
jgi:putative peptidoglycan lipid II flippase